MDMVPMAPLRTLPALLSGPYGPHMSRSVLSVYESKRRVPAEIKESPQVQSTDSKQGKNHSLPHVTPVGPDTEGLGHLFCSFQDVQWVWTLQFQLPIAKFIRLYSFS